MKNFCFEFSNSAFHNKHLTKYVSFRNHCTVPGGLIFWVLLAQLEINVLLAGSVEGEDILDLLMAIFVTWNRTSATSTQAAKNNSCIKPHIIHNYNLLVTVRSSDTYVIAGGPTVTATLEVVLT
jgi:hypothetical protein